MGGREDGRPHYRVRALARALPRCEAGGGKTKVNWEEKKERSDDRPRPPRGGNELEGGREGGRHARFE